jgi:hypothetical protein
MSVALTEMEESANPSAGTGAGMIAFLNFLIRKNEMVEATAVALRTGCRKVLDTEDDWANVDIRTLDVDGLITRFRNKSRGDLAERSVSNYEQRFRSTVEMYRKWLEDDPSWRPSTRTRSTAAAAKRTGSGTNGTKQAAEKVAPAVAPAGSARGPDRQGGQAHRQLRLRTRLRRAAGNHDGGVAPARDAEARVPRWWKHLGARALSFLRGPVAGRCSREGHGRVAACR